MSESTPPTSPYAPAPPLSPADEKLWATLTHVGGVFFSFIPALIGYLVLRDRGPFIRAHSAEALNFQITVAIGYLVGLVLSLIIVGIFVIIAVGILSLVFSIIAAAAANNGQYYRYPITLRFVN